MMKILLVTNGYPPTAFGGVENYTADLARSLQAAGHAVVVICAERHDDLSDLHVIEDDVASVPVFRVVNVFKQLRSFSETFADPAVEVIFEGLLDRIAPDVVHFNHLISLSARLPQITTARGFPMLVTLHDFWFLCQRINLWDSQKNRCPGPKRGGDCLRCLSTGTWWQQARTSIIATLRKVIPYRLRVALRELINPGEHFLPDLHPMPEALDKRYHLFREACLVAHQVLAPSQFVKDVFVSNGYPAGIIEVLPLGMAAPPAASSPVCTSDRPITVGFIGSILPLKGVDVLLRAFRRVRSDWLRLRLYGRADVVPAYARTLRRLAWGDRRIRWMGPFPPEAKDDIYADVDWVVVPSVVHETFSLVAREALLRGRPVIASRVGALPEVVQDSINGFLVSPGDVDALEAVLARVAGGARPATLPGSFPVLTVEEHAAQMVAYYREAI